MLIDDDEAEVCRIITHLSLEHLDEVDDEVVEQLADEHEGHDVHDREIIELVDALLIDDDEVEHDELDAEALVDEDDDAEKDIVYLELKHYIDEEDDEVVLVVVQNDEDADEGLVLIDAQLLHIEVDEVEVELLVVVVDVVHDEMDVNEYL